MKLLTPYEASKLVYVTPSMISYWVRTHRIARHPIPGTTRRYLVDLDEVQRASKTTKFDKATPDNLISRKEAAFLLCVGDRMITYYVKMGYITAHYVYGNTKHYLVDKDEVLAQPGLMLDRIKHTARIDEYRERANQQPRSHGSRWSKRVEG